MPFIAHNERVELAEGKPAETVGQQCYLAYIKMVAAWNKEPRWTTAHKIYKGVLDAKQAASPIITDELVAKDLAWQVFFQNYVMPYEREKEKENGTI